MKYLIDFILAVFIIYLLSRSVIRYFAEEEGERRYREQEREREKSQKQKGVSKEIGEYIDYEEVDE